MSEDHLPNPFVLGRRSTQRLQQAHPDLVAVVELAIQRTTVDFTVMETLRTERRQRHLVRTGKSQTKNSRHLGRVPKNNPGLGVVSHAVDLGAWVNSAVSWDWNYYFQIADAIRQASNELDVPITWGGCWTLLDANTSAEDSHQMYLDRKRACDQKAFPDGPHFELSWEAYPCH